MSLPTVLRNALREAMERNWMTLPSLQPSAIIPRGPARRTPRRII